jgi:hypothetical protein
MLRFACPNCGATFKADERNAGAKGACHHCGQRLRVPPPPHNKTRLGVLLPEEGSPGSAKVERDWQDTSPPVRHASPPPVTPEPLEEVPDHEAEAPANSAKAPVLDVAGLRRLFLGPSLGSVFCIGGCVVLFLGMFAPVVSVGEFSFNYYQSCKVSSGAILTLALISAALSFTRVRRWLWVGCPGLLLILLGSLLSLRADMNNALAPARQASKTYSQLMSDTPLGHFYSQVFNQYASRFMPEVSWEWGWLLLLLGVMVVTTSPLAQSLMSRLADPVPADQA